MEIDVPAGTAATSPVRDERKLVRGMFVKEVVLHIPPGPAGLAPIWFELHKARLIPSDNGSLALDDVPNLTLPVGVLMDRDGEFALAGYNSDPDNAHKAKAILMILLPGDPGYPARG